MTTQKPRDDPSTEQIMESIGRIVLEGEGGAGTPAADAPPAAAQPEARDEDVLDLIEVVDEQGNPFPPERAFAGVPPISPSAAGDGSAGRGAEGGRASEDQVLDALRPMLQSWLDTNMPPIVERLVRQEIERAARSAEPE